MSNNKEVMESDTFIFTWNISNFISRTEEMVNGTYLKSRNFTIKGPGNKSTNMHVNLYPNGYDSESKDYVSVFLFNNDDAENSTCDSSYPPVNGFCRNENNDGAAMKPYEGLVPPAYCPRKDDFDRDDNPRCRIGYNSNICEF